MARLSSHWPRSPLAWAVTIFAVLTLLAGCLLAGAITLEPVRASIWQARGTHCGTILFDRVGNSEQDVATARARAQCLVNALARCRAATLDYGYGFLDGSTSHTFVVEPAAVPWQTCRLVDRWSTTNVGSLHLSGTERCTGLDFRSSELLVRSCGSLADVLIPFDQTAR